MEDSEFSKRVFSGGDLEQYELFFRQNYFSLCAYSQRYVGRVDVAEDIVSETFLKIWESRKTLVIKTSLKSYFFQAVYNNSLHYLRQLRAENRLEDYFYSTSSVNIGFPFLADQGAIDDKIEWEKLYQKVTRAIEKLPPQQKRVFHLKRFEKKKNREIAEILGISVKTVEMHLSKSMDSLRRELKNISPQILLILLQTG